MTHPIARPHRLVAVAAAALLALGAVGCSSDGESAQERYCDAGADLRADVGGLADLDLVSGGTDALEAQLEAIDEDLTALADAASEAAADEVDALEAAVSDLETAVSAVSGDLTSENVSTLSSSISSVVTAAQGVYDTLSDC